MVRLVIAVFRADEIARELHGDGHQRQAIHGMAGKMSEDAFAGVHGFLSLPSVRSTARMNSGLVPQQPPMKLAPASSNAGM